MVKLVCAERKRDAGKATRSSGRQRSGVTFRQFCQIVAAFTVNPSDFKLPQRFQHSKEVTRGNWNISENLHHQAMLNYDFLNQPASIVNES